MRISRALASILIIMAVTAVPAPAEPDWDAVGAEAIDLLGRYVRIRSVNPPANTTETAAFLVELLEREGIQVRTFESEPGKVNVLARIPASGGLRGDGGAVMLLHHMDVVPADPARWPVDPFSGEIRDGNLYGRGAMDMKGLGVIHLLAFVQLKRQGVPLSRDVLLLATADEETGGAGGARFMIEHHWDEMAPEYVLDEGGFGARDILAEDGRLVFSISVGEKKILWVKVVAEGTAGHGSQPTHDNANLRLMEVLASIDRRRSEAEAPALIEALSERIGGLADNKLTRAIRNDTVSVTTLRSGVGDPPKVNVIPSSAEATLDCRLLPSTDMEAFISDLRDAASGAGATIEVINTMADTPVTPHDTPLFAALERAITAEHPDAIVAPFLLPFGTDSNAFRVRGAKAYGLTPMLLDASIIASMHSDAERIPVKELVRGTRILYNTLTDLCSAD